MLAEKPASTFTLLYKLQKCLSNFDERVDAGGEYQHQPLLLVLGKNLG